MVALNRAAEGIWLAASPQWPTLSVDVLPTVGSTNAELMARGRRGEVSPCVLMAAEQTAGRGRLGRSWLAEPGRCLTLSIGLPLALDTTPGGGSAMSLVVGISAAQALKALMPAGAAPASPRDGLGLKWPNDLLWQGRKLGGILIEASAAPGLAAGERWVVVGIGINVQAPQQAASWPQAALAEAWPTDAPLAAPSATGPHTQALPCPDVGDVAQALVPALLQALPAFTQTGFASWQAAFAQLDVLADLDVSLSSPGSASAQQGRAQGVDGSGALLVHTPQGLLACTSGEVSVRAEALPALAPVPPAQP
jgi:BirA family biotin operon repressor/biotin-[acetyl-CoA-carboxylase] ligase